MGWGRPTCLSHRLRDDLQLKLTCPCGHVAMPDIKELRAAVWRRSGGEELLDLPRRLRCGICGSKRFRVELVWEDQATTASVLAAWKDLLQGRCSPAELQQRLEVHEQFGVTAGTMRTLSP